MVRVPLLPPRASLQPVRSGGPVSSCSSTSSSAIGRRYQRGLAASSGIRWLPASQDESVPSRFAWPDNRLPAGSEGVGGGASREAIGDISAIMARTLEQNPPAGKLTVSDGASSYSSAMYLRRTPWNTRRLCRMHDALPSHAGQHFRQRFRWTHELHRSSCISIVWLFLFFPLCNRSNSPRTCIFSQCFHILRL